MPFFFNGQLVETPAVVSAVDDTAMLVQSAGIGNVLAIIGKAAGGKPKTVLRFTSPEDAKRVLGKGDLLDCVSRAFDPSAETGGPSEVVAIRVDPAVQASLQLRDSLSAVVMTLTSQGYGLRENQVKVKVEAATGGRGLKLTTQRGLDYFTADNVFRNAFSVRYTGAQASGVMIVSGTQVILQAPSGTAVATIDLAAFPTVQELVDRIASVPDFTAAVLDGNGERPTLQALDAVTAQDIKTALYTARADLQAAVDWFNSSGEGFVNATRTPDAGTLPAPIPFTHLTGGTDGTTTNTDWSDAYGVLQTADVQWVVPASSDAAIHAMNDAHCVYMSNVGRMERRGAVGTALATTDGAAITAAKALNSDRTSLIHIGGWDYDANGALKLYPPYVVAAMYAGGFCGLSPGEPMTAKSLRLRGLERDLRVPGDTDALLRGGVMPIENAPDGYRVVQSISTWLTNTKFNRREQSCGVATDFTVRALRDALKAVKGVKGTPQALGLAKSLAETTLSNLARQAPAGPGVLAGDDENPAYRGLKLSMVGDAIMVSVQASPVIPTNYVGVTVYVQPFSGSASLA